MFDTRVPRRVTVPNNIAKIGDACPLLHSTLSLDLQPLGYEEMKYVLEDGLNDCVAKQHINATIAHIIGIA